MSTSNLDFFMSTELIVFCLVVLLGLAVFCFIKSRSKREPGNTL